MFNCAITSKLAALLLPPFEVFCPADGLSSWRISHHVIKISGVLAYLISAVWVHCRSSWWISYHVIKIGIVLAQSIPAVWVHCGSSWWLSRYHVD